MEFTTKEGLVLYIKDNAFDDMEMLDSLVEMDQGNPLAVSKIGSLLFEPAEKKKLYDYYRDETGRIPFSVFVPIITDIMLNYNKESKN